MVPAGLVTAAALAEVRAMVAPGATGLDLDAAAERIILSHGGESNFKLVPGYHHTLCVSVNDAVVHGIPNATAFQPGDLVSVDGGAQLDGWNGDSAFSLVVPGGDPALSARRQALSDVTEASLWAGIAALASAKYLNEVGAAIEEHVTARSSYGILRDYIGHGIGRVMHEEPPVFNYRVTGKSPQVRPGLVVAIEPMIVERDIETDVDDDDWTVRTVDGGDASHWEHSVAVHEGGIWVLTAADGGAAGLAQFGVTPVPIA